MAHQIHKGPTISVLVERSKQRHMQLCKRCLLYTDFPENARHLWECQLRFHEWRPPRQCLMAGHLCGAPSTPGTRPVAGPCGPRAVVHYHCNAIKVSRTYQQ